MQFGLITDRKLCPDPEDIIRRFEPEFDKLITSLMWCENGYVGADARAFDAMLNAGGADANAVAPAPVPRIKAKAAKPRARAKRAA